MPSDADGLRRTFLHVHARYTGYVNARLRVTGHLWQGRFGSVAMDEAHFVTALRYVALRKAESVGRPIGSAQWLVDMEARTGKVLAAQKRGPKGKRAAGSSLNR